MDEIEFSAVGAAAASTRVGMILPRHGHRGGERVCESESVAIYPRVGKTYHGRYEFILNTNVLKQEIQVLAIILKKVSVFLLLVLIIQDHFN